MRDEYVIRSEVKEGEIKHYAGGKIDVPKETTEILEQIKNEHALIFVTIPQVKQLRTYIWIDEAR